MSSCRRKTKEQQHKNRIKTNIHARLFQISFEIILHALQTAALVSLSSVNNLHGHRRHILQSRENCLGQGAPARGVLNKCLYGEAPPRGPTPYPFIYHFSRKRYPFRIPSIDKWYPFHIPCLELCIPFNCCKCTVF